MAKSQARLLCDLAAIEEQLNSGVTSVTVDGTTTVIDLDHLRKRAADLRAQIDTENARRPLASTIYLGGF